MSISANGSRAIILATMVVSGSLFSGTFNAVLAEAAESAGAPAATAAQPHICTKYVWTHYGPPGKGFDQAKRVAVPCGTSTEPASAPAATELQPSRPCTKIVWTHSGPPGKGFDQAKRVAVPCEQRR